MNVLLLHADDRYMSKREACAYTSLSDKTLDNAPDLPRYKLPGKTLFKKSELDAWLQRYRERRATIANAPTLKTKLAEIKARYGVKS